MKDGCQDFVNIHFGITDESKIIHILNESVETVMRADSRPVLTEGVDNGLGLEIENITSSPSP